MKSFFNFKNNVKENKFVKFFDRPLWQIVALFFVLFIVLSWVMPATSYDGAFKSLGIKPVGMFDWFRAPLLGLEQNIALVMFILFIGGYYGVLNKTGAYTKLVNFIVEAAKDRKKEFIVLVAVIFALISSLTALNLVIFLAVPFIVAVLYKLGFSKISTMLSTIGAIVVGNFGSMFGFQINTAINYVFQLENTELFYAKALALIGGLVILAFALWKDEAKTKHKTIPLYKEHKGKERDFLPLGIVFDLVLILALISNYSWHFGLSQTTQISFFVDLHENIMKMEIFGFKIMEALLGSVNPIGYWNFTELGIILVIASGLLAFVYNIKLKEMVYEFIDGMKQMLIPAFYVAISFVVFGLFNSVDHKVYFTILEFITTNFKDSYLMVGILAPIFGSLFMNNFFEYAVSFLAVYANQTPTGNMALVGLSSQMIHSALMLVIPTSTMLLLGLSYFKISFVEWFKGSKDFILQLLAFALGLIVLLWLIV